MIRARRLVVALAVVGLVVLAGCTTIRGLIETEDALEQAGFTEVEVNSSSTDGFDRVDVTVRPPSRETPVRDVAEEAARVVWETFPLRFDLVRVDVLGPADGFSTTYTYNEMAEIFGARPARLDEKELGDDVVRAGVGVLVVLAVGGLFFTTAVVLAIVFGVRASRRRASATPPPWPPVPRS